MPAMCVRIRTQKRSERFQVCVKVNVRDFDLYNSCKTRFVRSATCRAKPKPEGRAHPRRLHGALGVALPQRLSHHTPHVVYRALHLHVLSLRLSLSLVPHLTSLRPRTPSPTLAHTQHTHTPRRSSFPIPFSPPLPSPLYPRADHSSSADGARCGAIGCGCTGTLGCGLVAACIALSCIAIAVTFNT